MIINDVHKKEVFSDPEPDLQPALLILRLFYQALFCCSRYLDRTVQPFCQYPQQSGRRPI
jgi:hypothetical protein